MNILNLSVLNHRKKTIEKCQPIVFTIELLLSKATMTVCFTLYENKMPFFLVALSKLS